MVQEVGHHLLLPIRALEQAGPGAEPEVEPVSGVWNYGFGSLAEEGWALAPSEVREADLEIEEIRLPDARYAVKGYRRRWRVVVLPSSLG